MLVYTGTKSSFMDDVLDQTLAEKVKKAVELKMHRVTPLAEYKSWENSMIYMRDALSYSKIPDDCGVAIEYNVPLTSKRVDFIVSGLDARNHEHATIVELKQWEKAEACPGLEAVVRTYTGGAVREVAHPSYQAWSYAACIANFNADVQDKGISLHPCAYAHNYEIDGTCALTQPEYKPYLDRAPLFGKHEVRKVGDFIKLHLVKGDKGKVLADIDNGAIRPSKSLQDELPKLLAGKPEFVLLDDQKVVYERALLLARQAKKEQKKHVLIVQGGPGTGKSVISINLLVNLMGKGLFASYVTKNSAPRSVYKTELKGQKKGNEVDLLFKGSGSFNGVKENLYDALIVDEAHRLVEKGQYDRKGTENQIVSIIKAARFSVFFIDESQRVTTKDFGTVERIKHYAKRLGAIVHMDKLESQFRCDGSDGYLAWLDNTLGIRDTANWSMEGNGYDIEIFDSPSAMEKAIRAKNGRNKARIVAGYCWEWPKVTRAASSYHDIQIGDWSISWNLDNTHTYAIDDGSVNEAGCIHTVQGLEFDYVGVIIGDDMRYVDGKVITDASKRAKSDASLTGLKKLSKTEPERAHAEADEIIRNTYRTLMTRGMKGCYVYCTDAPLREYLRSRIESFDVTFNDNTEIVRLEQTGTQEL